MVKLRATLPPPPREKAQRIRTAARERIRRFGYAKVTMDDLAADLGLVKGALYYYFPTKESLFKAVIQEEQEEFIREARRICDQSLPAAAKLQHYVHMRLGYFRELVNFSLVDPNSWNRLRISLRDLYSHFEEVEAGFLEQILVEGRRSGEFAVARPRDTAELLLHVLRGVRLRSFRARSGPEHDETADAELADEMQRLTGILLSGLATRDGKKGQSHGTNRGRATTRRLPAAEARRGGRPDARTPGTPAV